MQRLQASGAAGLLEIVETADPEFVVKDSDLLQPESRDAQKLEDSRRILLSELLQIARRAGAKNFFDDRGGRFSDPRCFQQIEASISAGSRSSAEMARDAFSKASDLNRFASLSSTYFAISSSTRATSNLFMPLSS
jgi:hypothetical protein